MKLVMPTPKHLLQTITILSGWLIGNPLAQAHPAPARIICSFYFDNSLPCNCVQAAGNVYLRSDGSVMY